jgi:hypothetical protein
VPNTSGQLSNSDEAGVEENGDSTVVQTTAKSESSGGGGCQSSSVPVNFMWACILYIYRKGIKVRIKPKVRWF